MGISNYPPDFIAIITHFTTEQGGRHTPAASGYRPHVKFPFDKMSTTGQQHFIGKDMIYPGETTDAEIRILSVEYFKHKLEVGMSFEVREGLKITGTGIIKEIINAELKKQ